MKSRTIPFIITAILAVAGSAYAEEVFIHFEDMNPGDSVAGIGTLHPNLDIQPLNAWGPLTVIQTFNEATKVYKAPNRDAWDVWHTNNSLEDRYGQLVDSQAPWFDPENPVYANGFANTACSWRDSTDTYFCPQEFLITFNNRRVARFQMLMTDFGDWNPTRGIFHQAHLRGYENGVMVAEFHFDYMTDPVAVPRWCSDGFDPKISADACSCKESGRGHSHMEINAPPGSPGFDEVQLVMGDGWDPNTGFDSLRIDFVNLFDVEPMSCPNPINLGSEGLLPAAVLGTAEFDVATIIPATCELEGVLATNYAYEDVSTPFVGLLVDLVSCTREGADGYMDLTLKFPNSDVAAAIVASHGSLPNGASVIVTLTCDLADGSQFVGQDILKVLN